MYSNDISDKHEYTELNCLLQYKYLKKEKKSIKMHKTFEKKYQLGWIKS